MTIYFGVYSPEHHIFSAVGVNRESLDKVFRGLDGETLKMIPQIRDLAGKVVVPPDRAAKIENKALLQSLGSINSGATLYLAKCGNSFPSIGKAPVVLPKGTAVNINLYRSISETLVRKEKSPECGVSVWIDEIKVEPGRLGLFFFINNTDLDKNNWAKLYIIMPGLKIHDRETWPDNTK